ncbi:TlpA disulfide reductase family protein [Accumulibacter sp.]|mgnify:CR=1 FL=1|uniref:TlpA family protein disulfide reductase n=1 Tax=Accumulibacter sp. TaxID=2053492 RepID=UPI0025BCACFA|nr:TlpA disulfide reductase family protein [Accumulibacter sp.]
MRALRHLLAVPCLALSVMGVNAAELPSAAPLFALTLSDAEQRTVALGSFRGKPLLVNFWARWCMPCRKEIPDLAEVHSRYISRDLVVIGIAIEDVEQRQAVRDFARAYEMNYLSLIGGTQSGIELMRALGNAKSGLPFTVVIDREGRVRRSKLGAMNRSEMDDAIRPLL